MESMTIEEAIEWFKGFYNGDCEREDFEDTICADCNFPCRHGMPILMAISALEEIQQYRAIGTVSEFRELKEKATAKKQGNIHDLDSHLRLSKAGFVCCCTTNKEIRYPLISFKDLEYCPRCGQKLDWSEGKE